MIQNVEQGRVPRILRGDAPNSIYCRSGWVKNLLKFVDLRYGVNAAVKHPREVRSTIARDLECRKTFVFPEESVAYVGCTKEYTCHQACANDAPKKPNGPGRYRCVPLRSHALFGGFFAQSHLQRIWAESCPAVLTVASSFS